MTLGKGKIARSPHLPAGQAHAQGKENSQTGDRAREGFIPASFSHTSLCVSMSHRPQITSSGPLEVLQRCRARIEGKGWLPSDSYGDLSCLHHLGIEYKEATRGAGPAGTTGSSSRLAALIRAHVAAVQPYGDVRPTAPGPQHVRPLVSREQSVLHIPMH